MFRLKNGVHGSHSALGVILAPETSLPLFILTRMIVAALQQMAKTSICIVLILLILSWFLLLFMKAPLTSIP